MMADQQAEWTETILTQAILKQWPFVRIRPRWVCAIQVRDAAGFSAWRTLDAVVFDTWPSGGLGLHGLEIKVSRADFRKELHDPEKAAQFTDKLERFSIVAAPGVADLELMPKAWGLYVPASDGTLRCRRKALPLRPGKATPPVVDRSFMAAFVRALVDRSLDRDAFAAEYDRGYQNGKDSTKREVGYAEARADSKQEKLDAFEKASGVSIDSYRAGQIGEAVKLVLDGGIQQRINYSYTVRSLGENLVKLADELDALAGEFGTRSKEAAG
jgi:hypothetical protein